MVRHRSHAPGSSRGRRIVLAAIVASASFGAAAGRAAVGRAAFDPFGTPSPSPLATATPAPTPPARPAAAIPTLPDCSFSGRFDLTATRVAVGDVVTGTIDARLTCPDGLRARSTIVMLGAVDVATVAPVRDAIAHLVRGLAAADAAAIAFVNADAPAVPPRFLDVAMDRPAIDAIIAGLTEREPAAGDEWAAQVDAVRDTFDRLPPSRRPLFVLVDGGAPGGDADAAAGRLRRLVGGLRDRLGLGLILDVSPSAWLRGIGEGGAAPADTLVYVHETRVDALPATVGTIVDTLGAPLDHWQLGLFVPDGFRTERTTLAIWPDPTESAAFPWTGIAHARELRLRAGVRVRALHAGKDVQLVAALSATRRSVRVGGNVVAAPAICVRAADDDAECAPPAAPPAPPGTALPPAPSTPIPPLPTFRPTPEPTVDHAPTSPVPRPERTASAGTATPAARRWVLYMPFGRRAPARGAP